MTAGRVIRSFAAPGLLSFGLAWDGARLWVQDDVSNLIYQLDPVTARVLRSFTQPHADITGICVVPGRNLYAVSSSANLVYEVDIVTGRTLRSFSTPAADCYDMAWDGRYLWLVSDGANLIYQLDLATGQAIRSLTALGVYPRGVACNGRTLFHAPFDGPIYEIDPVTDRTIRSFTSPTTSLYALAWDGARLWVLSAVANMVYQVEVS